jgi:hypothetical protein
MVNIKFDHQIIYFSINISFDKKLLWDIDVAL